MRDVMGEPPEQWKEVESYLTLLPEQKIIPIGPRESEIFFLERCEELMSHID